ncbi:ABC transporter permease [Anaerocolumna xylanovorans]|uniref:Ribose transport system permease protein n=1 Tax=Anaerocolumna xylanovorans DSM 12503 TaxID=1121345 RepID=A0A1M7YN34_9FIRM|nr:ABC transporter permease [Anaerocolumna xylanovorans]SHO54050.1 ribose transport system permease protein [Anaerocolumna xylanovorans DSM 12503]
MEKVRKKWSLLDMPTEGMIFIVLIVMCVVLALIKPAFISQYNLSTLIRTISWTTIVAFGQTLVLLTGGIDLSVAGVAGMSGVISAYLMVNTGMNPFVAIVLVLVLALGCGCLNGILITKLNMVPFIVTLATGSVFTGVIYVITKGSPILGIPQSAVKLGQGMLFHVIPYPALFMILSCIVLAYIAGYTPFGRYIYAVGGNPKAARIAGIKSGKVIILTYGICAFMASIAGILITCRLGTAQPSVGSDWVMPSVTAACIGGTSLAGGKGKIIGALVGGIFMGVISNAITILAVSTYWEKVITGIVILVAIAIDRFKALRNNEI